MVFIYQSRRNLMEIIQPLIGHFLMGYGQLLLIHILSRCVFRRLVWFFIVLYYNHYVISFLYTLRSIEMEIFIAEQIKAPKAAAVIKKTRWLDQSIQQPFSCAVIIWMKGFLFHQQRYIILSCLQKISTIPITEWMTCITPTTWDVSSTLILKNRMFQKDTLCIKWSGAEFCGRCSCVSHEHWKQICASSQEHWSDQDLERWGWPFKTGCNHPAGQKTWDDLFGSQQASL